MLAMIIAKEIEALSKVDDWLRRSTMIELDEQAWKKADDKMRHEEAVKVSRSSSMAACFPSGAVCADIMASALSQELSRLAHGVQLMKLAMENCKWPEFFEKEGYAIMSSIESITSD